MRSSWTQAAAGALFVAVLGGMALLPGRLLGPDHRVPVIAALPQRLAASEVEAAPPLVPQRSPLRRARVAPVPHVVRVAAPTPAPAPAPAPRVRAPRPVLAVQHPAAIARVAPQAPNTPATPKTRSKPAPAPA